MYPLSPEDHYRLHFIRSRYMNDYESELLRLCILIAEIGRWPEDSMTTTFRERLKLFPKLAGSANKTIDNFLTEVTSLFSLYVISGESGLCGANASMLADSQDFITFFLHHQIKFQFPGGHVKANKALEHANLGIHFKPAQFFTKVFMAGQRLIGKDKSFGITPEEATWYITNDLRVLRGERSPETVAQAILEGREAQVDLSPPTDLGAYRLPIGITRTPGDFFRYARDCMKMLEYAQVVKRADSGYRYLSPSAEKQIKVILADESWFDGYSTLVGLNPSTKDMEDIRHEWLAYANDPIPAITRQDQLCSDPSLPAFVEPPVAATPLELAYQTLKFSNNEIGAAGEEIVIRHEKKRLIAAGRKDLAKKVIKLPDQYGVGYDILSFEANEAKRYIEVKTTRSLQRVTINSFHLTTNEWKTAESNRDSYFVYRVILSENDGIDMVIITNPVGRYKKDELEMTPRNGAEIQFDDRVSQSVRVLL